MQQGRSQHCSLETKNGRDGQIEPICGCERAEAKRSPPAKSRTKIFKEKNGLP